LSKEAVASIENLLLQMRQITKQNLQQYQEAFTRAIQWRYPLSDDEHDSGNFSASPLNLGEEIPLPSKQVTQILRENYSNIRRHSLELFSIAQ